MAEHLTRIAFGVGYCDALGGLPGLFNSLICILHLLWFYNNTFFKKSTICPNHFFVKKRYHT